ncbi:MAG: hypothetical protein ACXQS2_01945 [Methermicoccaceae archaeon]
MLDLKEILGEVELVLAQCYSDGWPVNRAAAGTDLSPITEVKGLYVVGDGAKGDEIEVDGIAMGVSKVIEHISHNL